MKNENFLTSQMSVRAYNITIGLILFWGFFVNVLMCKYLTPIFMECNLLALIIGYFLVAFLGIYMSSSSRNPLISFIGYNLVVVPVGMVLSIALVEYNQVTIMNAFLITALVTGMMVLLAVFFPNVFLSMGRMLGTILLGTLVIEILLILFGIAIPTFWDFLVALLFCAYIGYDWAVAQRKERTLDNAVDSVVELYLDIVNLFIRIIEVVDD